LTHCAFELVETTRYHFDVQIESHLSLAETTYYSFSMEGKTFSPSSVSLSIGAKGPTIDRRNYSDNTIASDDVLFLLHPKRVCCFSVRRGHSISLLSRGTRSFLGFNSRLLTHGGKDDDVGVLLFDLEEFVDLLAKLTIGHANIVLGFSVFAHEGKEAIIRDVQKLVFLARNIGNVHVMGRRAEILELLASEDVNSDEMDFGVAVLARLGGGHVDDLARATLDDDVAVLPQGRALHRIGGGGASIGGVELVLMLRVVRHVGRE